MTSPLATPAPAAGTPNNFGVRAKSPHVFINNVLTKEPLTLTEEEAFNLAVWIAAVSKYELAYFLEIAAQIRATVPLYDEGFRRFRNVLRHATLVELVHEWMAHTKNPLTTDARLVELIEWSEQRVDVLR